MIGGDDHERPIGEPARVERVEYAAQLLVRDAQDVRQAVLARHALQAAAVLLAKHMGDLVDTAEGQEHARP